MASSKSLDSLPSQVGAGRALPSQQAGMKSTAETILIEESQALDFGNPASPEPSRSLNIYEKKFLENADAPVPPTPLMVVSRDALEGKDEGDQKEKGLEECKGQTGEEKKENQGEKGHEDKEKDKDDMCADEGEEEEGMEEDCEVEIKEDADMMRKLKSESAPIPPQNDTPGHHILDPLIEKVLKRSEQDEAYVAAGGKKRGRGKGGGKGRSKGRGKGRGKGKGGKEKDGQDSMPAPKRKQRKTTDATASNAAAVDCPEAPAPASVPSAASPKPKAKAKTRATRTKPAIASPKLKRVSKSKKTGDSDQVTKPARGKAQAKKPEKQEIPAFKCSNVVPYWNRPACGLKVPVRLGKPETDPDHLSTKTTQAFYVGIKKAPMKEMLNIIIEIVSKFK